MIYGILAANLKNYIDFRACAEALSPERSVFQISVGGKKNKTGWHYTVRDGICQFKRGLYSGETVIDWNDEFKYKEKSKKQIVRETTPDYEISFKDGQEFDSFIEEAGKYMSGESSKKPKVKGSKLSGSKCVPAVFDNLLTECAGLHSPHVLSLRDADLSPVAVRMALFALAEAFNILLKEGAETFRTFAEGDRRSYFFDTAKKERQIWVTVQGGLLKVTANQGTKLPALCGLEFENDPDALSFVYGDVSENLFDKAYIFCGSSVYGDGLDRDGIRKAFRDCCLEAVKAINSK